MFTCGNLSRLVTGDGLIAIEMQSILDFPRSLKYGDGQSSVFHTKNFIGERAGGEAGIEDRGTKPQGHCNRQNDWHQCDETKQMQSLGTKEGHNHRRSQHEYKNASEQERTRRRRVILPDYVEQYQGRN